MGLLAGRRFNRSKSLYNKGRLGCIATDLCLPRRPEVAVSLLKTVVFYFDAVGFGDLYPDVDYS